MPFQSYEDLLKRAKTNLPKTVEVHERFQIPMADIQVEGKTTILRNFADICETIRRPADQVLAYLLREIGTAGVLEDRRVVFKGKVTTSQIQDRIQGYVDNIALDAVRSEEHTSELQSR